MKRMRAWALVLAVALVLADIAPSFAAEADQSPQEMIITEETAASEEAPSQEAVGDSGSDPQMREPQENAEPEEAAQELQENAEPEETASEPQENAESEEAASEPQEVSPESSVKADGDSSLKKPYLQFERSTDEEDYSLEAGESLQTQVSTNLDPTKLIYTSDNPAAATVDAGGRITAISAGAAGSVKVEISVSYELEDGVGYSDSLEITVYNTVSLNKKSATLYCVKGQALQLKAVSKPEGAVTWKSDKTEVAKVDKNGTVTPIGAGKAKITATANGVSATCTVTVKKASISMSQKATVYLSNPKKLKATAYPSAKIKWSSSDKKIATVDSKGLVTGKKKGTVTIFAKANGVTQKCKVKIAKPSVQIYSYGEQAIYQGGQMTLYASAKPADKLKWKSSNKSIATVDKNGVVTAKKAGEAVITAYVGGAKSTCSIIVFKNPYKFNFSAKTMVKGEKATLYVKGMAADNVSFWMTNSDGSVQMEAGGDKCKLKAVGKGTTTICASASVYENGYYVYWQQECTIKVTDVGISRQQLAVAKGKKASLKLVNVPKEKIAGVLWSSSAPSVATVSQEGGEVKGVSKGTAKISATVTFVDGSRRTFTSKVSVTDPKLGKSTLAAAVGSAPVVSLKNISSYSEISYKSTKKSVVAVSANGTLRPKKKGTATIEVTVDQKTLKCKVYVSNPKLKKTYEILTPGARTTFAVSGLTKKSSLTYTSGDKSVATVSKKGVVTAKRSGKTWIVVKADGQVYICLVEIVPPAVYNARNTAYSIMYSSTYSQARRMSPGFYDCSSLVFRAYGKDVGLLGGSASWAPTAAAMAAHLGNTGKVIAYGPVDVSVLLPGDLIFYGNSGNGRYLGINHVSMYYGNGNRLEKPLCKYYQRSNIVMVARPVR